ncbi:MAG: polysaccharide biosynthesis protein [Lachnospiraceae bacterium]|nr:polysaccharide biosynthesis protein [Lachnospiraceae bacterium]
MADQRKENTSFLIQGSILAVSSVIVRLIGIVYRVPLTNILGDAIGVYSSAYSIYSVIWLISSFGIPTAVSKMVAGRRGMKRYRDANKAYKTGMLFALIAGGLASLVMALGAPFFAKTVLNMEEAELAIRFLAPTMFFSAFLGVYRGYFQGLGTMIPTALSQIFEQIINAVASVLAAHLMYNYGKTVDRTLGTNLWANAYGAAGGTVGTWLGALIALIFCIFVYALYRRVLVRLFRRDKASVDETYPQLFVILGATILPVVFNSAIYNISSVLDNSIFGHYTSFAGIRDQYIGVWASYEGKYHLLTHVPLAFATSIAASLIPAITSAHSAGLRTQVVDRVKTSIRFTMLVAVPSCVGLGVLAGPIVNLLFSPSAGNELAIKLLQAGCITVIFYSFSQVTNAALQGINRMRDPVVNAAISLAVHILVMVICLWVFKLGIYGVLVSDIVFGILMNVLNIYSLSRHLRLRIDITKTLFLPAGASLIMGAAAWGVYHLLFGALKKNAIAALAAIFVAVLVYGVALLLTKCVDEVDLYQMPKGKALVELAKKVHLLK